jgi:RimJ/RimL family protein N-acetyltransferase
MLRYGFETLGLHRIGLRVAAYSTRAIRCYEKCGFRLEGVERDSFLVDGEWHDDWLMAVLRDEWEAEHGH